MATVYAGSKNKPQVWYNEELEHMLAGRVMQHTPAVMTNLLRRLAMNDSIHHSAQKRCPKCGETKSASAFAPSIYTKDGYASICRLCNSHYSGNRRKESLPDGQKRCRVCQEVQPFENFFLRKANRDGHDTECKSCHKARQQRLLPGLAPSPRKSIKGIQMTQRPKEDLPEGHKRCLKCNEVKPYPQFSRRKTSKDGYYSYCKACDNQRPVRIGYLPETKRCATCGETKPSEEFYVHRSAKYTGLSSECKVCSIASATSRNLRTYSYLKSRRALLRDFYGLTLEEYDAMEQAQGGVCAACHLPETRTLRGKVIPLAVDHDAKTGQVRGLLCSKCNMALGLLKDDPQCIEGLLLYIRSYNTEKDGG